MFDFKQYLLFIFILLLLLLLLLSLLLLLLLEIEHGTFTPLVFTTTGGMADECRRYHCRLAELISTKKGEPYAATISWIRT